MENLFSALFKNYILVNEASKHFNTKMKKYVQKEGWKPTSVCGLMSYYVKNGDSIQESLIASPIKLHHRECADNEYQKNVNVCPFVKAKVYHTDDYSILETWFDETLEKHYRLEVFRDGVNRMYSYGYASKVADQHNPKEIRHNTLTEILPILLEP